MNLAELQKVKKSKKKKKTEKIREDSLSDIIKYKFVLCGLNMIGPIREVDKGESSVVLGKRVKSN